MTGNGVRQRLEELAITDPEDESLPLVARWIPSIAENARLTQQQIDHAVTGRFRDDGERQVAGAILAVTADLSLLEVLRFSAGAVGAGVAALRAGSPLVVDDNPVAQALDQPQLERLRCTVYCGVQEPGVLAFSRRTGLPWYIEGMRRVQQHVDGAVIAIGHEPAALLFVLDRVDAGLARPALIIGLPWGFVAATEAKAELLRREIPAIVIEGMRGGSRLAAAVVNALLWLPPPDEPLSDDSNLRPTQELQPPPR